MADGGDDREREGVLWTGLKLAHVVATSLFTILCQEQWNVCVDVKHSHLPSRQGKLLPCLPLKQLQGSIMFHKYSCNRLPSEEMRGMIGRSPPSGQSVSIPSVVQ